MWHPTTGTVDSSRLWVSGMSNNMGQLKVNVFGMDTLYAELDRRFSGMALLKVIDAALIEGAKVIKRELEKNFAAFAETWASHDEITIGEPATTSLTGMRYIQIYWSGPKNRYSIIHLNEFGTIHSPRPRGFGAVERALRQGVAAYQNAIRKTIGRAML